ncbi:MAG: hypothetical protein J0L67_02015 [Cytophagales bacterium]|nr:hypothetical protein [Cytophagales bacterium]
MKVIGLLLTIVTSHVWGQNVEIPNDLNKGNILIELNTFERTVELLNKEFERSNDKEKRDIRKQAIRETKIPHNRDDFGDGYAVAIPYNIVSWINETITKSFQKDKAKKYTIVNESTIDNFSVSEYRYVLKYKYVLKNGDPIETMLIFYFFDRQENRELINYDSIDALIEFRPVMYYTAEKMYPFYDMIRIYGVKKEFETFFKEL